MSKFVSRKSAPSISDKHWIKSTCGGLNECLKISGNSCLPNCVGYAWGRFYELTGEKPRLSTGNAENWYPNTADGYKRSATPKLGAVACWRKGKAFNEADGCGHVAIVEEIKPNGDIVCSNSAYGGSRFYVKEYSKSTGYNYGALTFQGFILPPVEFDSVSADELAREVIQRLTETGCDWEDVQERVTELLDSAQSAPKKSVDEIAREVIRGDWGNGDERKMRLTEAGYDYYAVQNEVDKLLKLQR